jgi:hypothetical protein
MGGSCYLLASTNHSRGFDFTQSSFIPDFTKSTESQQRLSFLGCSVLASLRRVLQVSREVHSIPEFLKRRVSFPFFFHSQKKTQQPASDLW